MRSHGSGCPPKRTSSSMVRLSADSGSDVTYVLAVQVIRVFAMLLFAPLLGRWFRRRPS